MRIIGFLPERFDAKELAVNNFGVRKNIFQKSGENPPGGITNAKRCD
jgi:hypothetical protein